MRKTLLSLAATVLVAAPLALAAAPANATNGQQFVVNGDFLSSGPDGALPAPATTDFQLAVPNLFGTGNGSMYDPGRYTIASNPHSLHEAWIDLPEGNPMLIANGFQNENQRVWEEDVTASPCTTPGSVVTFDFTATAMNILRADWNGGNNGGANISVTVNGQTLGSPQDLTSNVGVPVQFVGAVPAASHFDVAIWNNGTAYTGNDFAIDDISLIQRGDCAPPCVVTHTGVWYNYTGNYKGVGAPALTDPNWHALPATPGGEHALSKHVFDQPYRPGVDKGKGDWFVWRDSTSTCPS